MTDLWHDAICYALHIALELPIKKIHHRRVGGGMAGCPPPHYIVEFTTDRDTPNTANLLDPRQQRRLTKADSALIAQSHWKVTYRVNCKTVK